MNLIKGCAVLTMFILLKVSVSEEADRRFTRIDSLRSEGRISESDFECLKLIATNPDSSEFIGALDSLVRKKMINVYYVKDECKNGMSRYAAKFINQCESDSAKFNKFGSGLADIARRYTQYFGTSTSSINEMKSYVESGIIIDYGELHPIDTGYASVVTKTAKGWELEKKLKKSIENANSNDLLIRAALSEYSRAVERCGSKCYVNSNVEVITYKLITRCVNDVLEGGFLADQKYWEIYVKLPKNSSIPTRILIDKYLQASKNTSSSYWIEVLGKEL